MEKECFGQPIFPGALSDQLSSPFEVGSVRDETILGAGEWGEDTSSGIHFTLSPWFPRPSLHSAPPASTQGLGVEPHPLVRMALA